MSEDALDEIIDFWHRVEALMAARDKANNLDFKILWNDKIGELLSNLGCKRTPDEIREWMIMTDEQKQEVLRRIENDR